MSIGRIPGLLLAVIVMSGLSLLLIWTQAGEPRARAVFLEEASFWQRLRAGRINFIERLFREEAPLENGRGLRGRLSALYPRYAWRGRLLRLRLEIVKGILWASTNSRPHLAPLGILFVPIMAEALRQRAIRQSGLIVFPNELLFNFGIWILSLGTVGLVTGYVLSPVALPPTLIIGSLTLILAVGLMAAIAHIPGRFNHDK